VTRREERAKSIRAALLVGIAIAVGVGTVYAVTEDDRLRATFWGWTGGEDYAELNMRGLWFTDADNNIRTFGGKDQVVMGSGNDGLLFSDGQDALTFGGASDNASGAITFDSAGCGVANAFTQSKVYIRADNPDETGGTTSQITIRATDVVIQLGSGS